MSDKHERDFYCPQCGEDGLMCHCDDEMVKKALAHSLKRADGKETEGKIVSYGEEKRE